MHSTLVYSLDSHAIILSVSGAKEELQPTAERGQQKTYETAGVVQDKAKSAGNTVAANFSKLGGEHCLVTATGRLYVGVAATLT